MQPKPPHSFWFGHIPVLAKAAAEVPLDVHAQSLFQQVKREYDLGHLWVLDTWPISGYPTLVVQDPAVARQVAQTHSLSKHGVIQKIIGHIIGPASMLTSEGDAWRRTRSLFNPGFALSHLMTLVSPMVDHCLIFCQKLGDLADRKELFLLQELTTRLTIDIIGRAMIDVDLHTQDSSANELVANFRQTIAWTPKASELNPLVNWNPARPVMTWWHVRQMDRSFGEILDQRLAQKDTPGSGKPAIDLAIKAHRAQKGASSAMDPAFRLNAIDNIKTLMFGGHDTTSSTVCYVFYLLHLHPACLAELLKELDDVFGTEVDQRAQRIKNTPQLLNKLPYALAVIKETLRLYPVVSSPRQGEKG